MKTQSDHGRGKKEGVWLCICLGLLLGINSTIHPAESKTSRPLRIIVMDPQALPLSCSCVIGTGQRRYDLLAEHLKHRLKQSVDLTFDESLPLALRRTRGKADIIIGKHAMVVFDAAQDRISVRAIASLTDQSGDTGIKGVFLVKKESPIRNLRDLKGKIMLGPPEEAETNAAARKMLRRSGIENTLQIEVAGSIDSAALAVNDREADAAVVPEFMPPLLEACGKVERDSIRLIGTTEPVPGVTVFVTDSVDDETQDRVFQALLSVKKAPGLLVALESARGFVAPQMDSSETSAWNDWRGPERNGISPQLPKILSTSLKPSWTAKLTGPAMAGPAATSRFVVVPDKDSTNTKDIYRCFSAESGKEVWQLEYDAARKLNYSNAPRATPVIHEGLVYLLGALGDLHCVELETGKIRWRLNLFRDFGAEMLNWGSSCAPLVIDDKLIINPGAPDASIVALNRKTGRVLWQSPGQPAAYSAFVTGTFQGKRQIVGYDVAGLGGWETETGRRLWEVIPREGSDFNVTTPVIHEGTVFLATENNATRRYRFDDKGLLKPKPVSANWDLAPDTCTPVILRDRLFCAAYGELFCLDVNRGLKTIWSVQDDMFYDHVNVLAGNNRVLVWTMRGDLLLLRADADRYAPLSHLRPFGKESQDSMAHPAIVGDHLYLRSPSELACFRLRD